MEKNEIVIKALADAGKPVRPGEVAEITGIDKKEMAKIFKELKAEGKVISPKRCFYSLPE